MRVYLYPYKDPKTHGIAQALENFKSEWQS